MTGAPFRLGLQPGELIDRGRAVAFSFEGRTYAGHAGDTIASALAANGVRILSRSFKYRRPRGILTMAGQDANTLVQLADEPNACADTCPIADGLAVRGQNYSGSLERDRGAYFDRLGRVLPVGFYYKAFYKPKGAWRFWEPMVRRRAGLGAVNTDAHHGYFDKLHAFCDVAVIGGGPAGMAAALEAARLGAEVLLVEENPVLGGSLNYARLEADAAAAQRQRDALVGEVGRAPGITVMTSAVCQGWFPDHWLPVVAGNRLVKVRAKAVVLATGSIEQPMVFRNNDLPGIMMGTAAQRLIRQYGVRPGSRAVVAAANAEAYGVALDLMAAGLEVAAVVDLRETLPPNGLAGALRDHGVPVLLNHAVREAAPGSDGCVAGAVVAPIVGRGRCGESAERLDCDLLCMSVGYTPAAQILCHAGGRLGYDTATHMLAVRERPDGVIPAGSVNGAYALDAATAEGRHAGWSAARAIGLEAGAEPRVPNDRGERDRTHPWPIFPHPKGRDFVDFDEDLQVHDILDAIAEGYDHIELLKRYSTVGMGPSQGRLAALATVRLCADATHQEVAAVGTTTARPPFTAEKFGVLAGRPHDPVRLTPMHHRHVEAGAFMMVAGAWLRPAYYGPEARRAQCIRDEAVGVRGNVGLIDVSTLGGIEVRGPDAAELMERIYTFAYRKQPTGRARYVLMCDETGAIVDDGVACRLGEQHFYVTATTGAADNVYRRMLWWNAQWRLDVDIANATVAWCGVNVAGPAARTVLAKLCDDVDLAADAFPYMGVRAGTVAGIPARLLRVGFVGELGYEIHAPASQGEALWDALMAAGRDHGMRPFGVEAQRLLRLEKGHVIIGQDTDGLTHPHEADMAWAVSRRKPFFVGGRAIDIQMKRPLERKLVGFVLEDRSGPLPEECHLVLRNGDIAGRVTSIADSPTLEKAIGLAYVAPEQSEPGGTFDIKAQEGRIVRAAVVPLPFYDPENKRQEL